MIFIKIGRETDALGEFQHHQAFDSFWGRSVLLLSQKFWVRIYDHIIFSKTLTLSLPLSFSWWFLVRHHWHHDLTSDIMIWHLSQASGATRKGEPNGSPPLSSKGRLQINIVMTIRVKLRKRTGLFGNFSQKGFILHFGSLGTFLGVH